MIFDPPNSVFSAFAFIGVIGSLTPLCWHIKSANVGTPLFMFWSALGCLNFFINARVWNGNVTNPAPVWCDISTRVIIAENVAMPASVLCITRQLYKVTGLTTGTVINKRREAFIDLTVGFGLPILEMALSYIVQGHRFFIVEDIGCYPAIVNTPPAFVLMYLWPVIIALVSCGFGLCALYRFLCQSRELRSMLASDKGSRSRYIRLVILAGTDIFVAIPFAVYNLCADATFVQPYPSWHWIHEDFSVIYTIPESVWRPNARLRVTFELTRWSNVLCAVEFFVLFGTFSQEAIEHYRGAWRLVRSYFGRVVPCVAPRPPSQDPTHTPHITHLGPPAWARRSYVSFIDTVRSETPDSPDTTEKVHECARAANIVV
ncbi:STE3-domain-containing protein [Artomyces pyxidatus]|uniref:STE3-domain-containing protein n=1 Tax=Artomyces pyxidatus TaxID=48021 RepID=A0ACB8SYQ2_9AGAM|nr:STE3-domain-containing protein [Artomyces pyxidatus]